MNKFFNRQKGCNNTQIAEQNNYGLNVTQATEMAFAIFREYYPQLRNDILTDLKEIVFQKLNSFSPENIVPPNARIAVPILQNACITEEAEIRELYANLLANSMNKDANSEVHPAYVEIIKQLCPDEAKILRYLYRHNTIPAIEWNYVLSNGKSVVESNDFSIIAEIAGCECPWKGNLYFVNLLRLGPIVKSDFAWFLDPSRFEIILNHPSFQKKYKIYKLDSAITNLKCEKISYEITSFCDSFFNVCLYDPSDHS